MNFLLSIMLVVLLTLTACGQTGPLVLPPEYSDKQSNERPTQKPTL